MYALFFHLPKTAGRSINNWLAVEGQWPSAINKLPSNDWYKRLCGVEEYGIADIPTEPPPLPNGANSKIPVRILGSHRTWSKLGDILKWPFWEEFTVLREPAERLVSHYYHNYKKGFIQQSFEDWVIAPYYPICNCMWCFTNQESHKTNPIAWFYASKKVGPPPDNPLEQAREVLKNCRVYMMREVHALVLDMASVLEIDPTTYKSMYITGNGEKTTKEQRQLVRQVHELDYQLWEEFSE